VADGRTFGFDIRRPRSGAKRVLDESTPAVVAPQNSIQHPGKASLTAATDVC
jgi:hypothetical protein